MQITLETLIIALAILAIAAIAVVGGIVALIKQQVLVDKDTGNVVEVEIPLLGKLKTNYPSIGAILFGFLMVWLVVSWIEVDTKKIPMVATIGFKNAENANTADIFLSAIPQRYRRSQSGVNTDQPVRIRMDVDRGEDYDVIVYAPLSMREDGTTERAVEFGAMSIENIEGKDVATYNAELTLK